MSTEIEEEAHASSSLSLPSSSASSLALSRPSPVFYDYFGTIKEQNIPLIYSSDYNISFFGLEKLHPFDRYFSSFH